MKIKLTTTVYFDGVPYPAGSVIDPDAIGMNGEAVLQWQWAEPVDDESPVAIVPVYSEPIVEPIAQPVAELVVEPVVETVPDPTPEPPPAPRRKRTK
jgi:hypothetical protein